MSGRKRVVSDYKTFAITRKTNVNTRKIFADSRKSLFIYDKGFDIEENDLALKENDFDSTGNKISSFGNSNNEKKLVLIVSINLDDCYQKISMSIFLPYLLTNVNSFLTLIDKKS